MNESFPSGVEMPHSDAMDESDTAVSLVTLPFQESIFLVGMMGAGIAFAEKYNKVPAPINPIKAPAH